jgi:hydrogenase maturation protein HypF
MVRLAAGKGRTEAVTQRARITIRGAVQGVGFRPFVYRLARELRLPGWVSNSVQGVFIEADGDAATLDEFRFRLERDKPDRAFIQSIECAFLDPAGFTSFEIRSSDDTGEPVTLVLPDIATCSACLAEVLDPRDRRYRYPFTNCTHCGPRYSIIEALPYDRANTSMKAFRMCPRCREEYGNPEDRRFHAQPNACPECGPRLELREPGGRAAAEGDDALRAAAERILEGGIVALKGLGGFHLVVDSFNEKAVRRLRSRKHREEKPLAVMAPSMDYVRRICAVSSLEERLLRSPECPIVLLRLLRESSAAALPRDAIAQGNPNLGVMLPYTPLHHLLVAEIGRPIVATSGNISDEPICTDEDEALSRLGGIADLFLVHNRPIVRHVDDSIVRIVLGRELILRRARGYAPLPVAFGTGTDTPILGVGGHLKNTVALAAGGNIFLSQHIGDLENEETLRAFRAVIGSLTDLYRAKPALVAADAHPDYLSSRFAQETGLDAERVQHHFAHVASCMAENGLSGRVLGVSWDGTGYGLDGKIWGGEFLLADECGFDRVASFREFRLPGGSRAIREPRRAALGLLFAVAGRDLEQRFAGIPTLAAFTAAERGVVLDMLEKAINSPATSSAGRLFDAVASMAGVRQAVAFEGQAAMELEFAADGCPEVEPYPVGLKPPGDEADSRRFEVDWEPMIRAVVDDVKSGRPTGSVAARFHSAMAESAVMVARAIGEPRVVLTGGCFQNRILLERSVERLRQEGFRPYWHQRVPPNDGGIALGQVFAAAARLRAGLHSTVPPPHNSVSI